MSAVIVAEDLKSTLDVGATQLEDFQRSALQLACSLGLDLEKAEPLLRKVHRPYSDHEAGLSKHLI